jgi:CRP-like cAMP-binding protein
MSPQASEKVTTVWPGTFLASLNRDEREALNRLGLRRSFPRATVLMFQNEPDSRVMLLLAGRVKVTRVDGATRIYATPSTE